eukprot:1628605-Rhodomonas_salina.1
MVTYDRRLSSPPRPPGPHSPANLLRAPAPCSTLRRSSDSRLRVRVTVRLSLRLPVSLLLLPLTHPHRMILLPPPPQPCVLRAPTVTSLRFKVPSHRDVAARPRGRPLRRSPATSLLSSFTLGRVELRIVAWEGLSRDGSRVASKYTTRVASTKSSSQYSILV